MGCTFKLTAILALATSSQIAIGNAAVAQFNPWSNSAALDSITSTEDNRINRQLLGKDDGLPGDDATQGSGGRLFDYPHQSEGMPAEDSQDSAGSR